MRAATLALIVLLAATACGGSGSEDRARESLPRMTLQREDIPEALQPIGASFSTNTEAASGFGSPSEEQLNKWGRILGYQVDYQLPEPSREEALTFVSSSISLYRTAEGAAASFTDRTSRARQADWQTIFSDMDEFQQTELNPDLPVDDLLWLRFTGFQDIGHGQRVLRADDQIVFRVDNLWGFIGAISTAPEGEAGRDLLLPTVETLVRRQIENMRANRAALDLD